MSALLLTWPHWPAALAAALTLLTPAILVIVTPRALVDALFGRRA